MAINPVLRNRLLAAAAGGAIGIAAVLGDWYEGTGPTVRQPDGTVLHKPYLDPVGIRTVCRGITGKDVIRDKLYTAAECGALERKHLEIAEAAARRHIQGYDQLSKWARAALIDWFYNLGENDATIASTLVAKFNRGDVDGGCRQLTQWVKGRVNGQLMTLAGLVDRRGAETELCLGIGFPLDEPAPVIVATPMIEPAAAVPATAAIADNAAPGPADKTLWRRFFDRLPQWLKRNMP